MEIICDNCGAYFTEKLKICETCGCELFFYDFNNDEREEERTEEIYLPNRELNKKNKDNWIGHKYDEFY